jgi:uncharacterized membrane protein YadS
VATGIFIGGTIHDVAQVVGAGYVHSVAAGDAATLVKLFRVMLLVPVVLLIGMAMRRRSEETSAPRALPLFLVAFILLLVANSAGLVPAAAADALSQVSRWCLIVAIAALGVKTSLQQFAALGWRPIALMAGETVFLAALVLVALWVLR